jgi:small-conductance mechanosensitive channel
MNAIWQNLEYLSGMPILTRLSPLLAQAPSPAPAAAPETNNPLLSPITQTLTALGLGGLGGTLLNLIGAILILIIGWIVAAIVAGVVGNLLRRTNLDNRLASSVMGPRGGEEPVKIEKIISSIVFWIILIVAVVAFLDALNLTTVSQPLNEFLNTIFAYLPRIGAAAVLIAIAWALATLAKTVVTRSARSFGLDQRLATQTEMPEENQFLLSETLGNALYWFIFLFFLPLVLDLLNLQGPLLPVQNLLNDLLAALPRILKAVIIGAIGWLIARIVQGIVTNLLSAIGTDRLGARFGLSRATGQQSLSWIIGTIVYVLILIPTATAALDALAIPAISGPATVMLNEILRTLPQIFTAGLILVAGYIIGKFIADLVSNILTGIGFDNIFNWLGIQTPPAAPTPPPTYTDIPPPEEPLLIQESDFTKIPTTRTPSEIIGIVVLVGVMLFATVAATNILNLPALTTIITGLLIIFGQILAGLVVFAVGLYLANLAYNLITSSGTSQARILGQTARIAIIALVSAMALQQIGVATSIVNLAFGLLLGAVAVAIAISFGLGGRDVAAEQLRDWLTQFKRKY